MLTLYRTAPARFSTFGPMLAILACFFALGTFDTAQAQNLTVSTSTLTFTAPQGGNPNPPTQNVNVGGTGNYIISTASSWIFASTGAFSGTGGTAPDTLTVQINSSTLAAGSYSGTITLTPNAGTPVTISVSLTVSGSGSTSSNIAASPSQLSFGYQINHSTPPPQTTQITSSGIALPFSFSVVSGNCPTGWLQATTSGTTTPATLTVGIATTNLPAGTCSGRIAITSTTATNGTTTTNVGVSLYVTTTPLLNINVPPGLSNVTLQAGVKPAQFAIGLTSSDSNSQLTFTAAVAAGGQWLAISYPQPGVTPSTITVEIIPGNGVTLPPGTYQGSILLTSSGLFNGTNNTLSIPISFTLTSSSSVTVTPPGTVTFSQLQGGPAPASQTLTLTGAISSTFLTSVVPGPTGGAWLNVTPQTGSITPSTQAVLTLSVPPNSLMQGTYSSQVSIQFQNSTIPPITVFVSLNVAPPASQIVATPPSLSFSYQIGASSPPASQTIAISNPATGSLPYTVSSVSDSWISVTPASGATPGTLTVAVAPQSLQVGSYTGSFTLTSPGLATTTVAVALYIAASTTPQPFIIGNAASGVGSQLAPGEIISIKGSGLGPGTPVSFTLGSLTSPTLAGVQVTFDGFSGTLLYVSSTQINVTVPYEIAGHTSTSIVVTYQGVPSSPIVQPVGAAALGLFTNNATGSGQASVLNQNYSYNTAASPALQGSYIAVYATGGGQTSPASTDGEVSPSASLLPLVFQQFVTATIGGKAAPVVFAGASPGLVTGVVQFNIQVPSGVSGAAVPIVVSINNGSTVVQSQTGATVAVQ